MRRLPGRDGRLGGAAQRRRCRRAAAYLRAMAEELISCVCGVVVLSTGELDAIGLCFDCAALEPGQGCDCPECEAARERLFVAQTAQLA